MQEAIMGETKKISMRLDKFDIKMLEEVSRVRGTVFYGKNRTELVTDAIRRVYLPVLNEYDIEINENGGEQD